MSSMLHVILACQVAGFRLLLSCDDMSPGVIAKTSDRSLVASDWREVSSAENTGKVSSTYSRLMVG